MEPTHPVTGDTLTDLERSLWRLRMVAHEAQTMHRGFNRSGDVAKTVNEELLFCLTHQALIIVCKFLEIWDDLGKLAKIDPRIIPARRAIQPIIDRMLVWKGLDTFRNSTLAHAYLDKKGNLLPPWELLRSGLAPSYHAEVLLLLFFVHYAVLALLCVFQAEYLPIDPLARPPKNTAPLATPGITLGTDIPSELRKVLAEVDRKLKIECDLGVGGPISTTFAKAIEA